MAWLPIPELPQRIRNPIAILRPGFHRERRESEMGIAIVLVGNWGLVGRLARDLESAGRY